MTVRFKFDEHKPQHSFSKPASAVLGLLLPFEQTGSHRLLGSVSTCVVAMRKYDAAGVSYVCPSSDSSLKGSHEKIQRAPAAKN